MSSPLSLYRRLHRSISKLPPPHNPKNMLEQLRTGFTKNLHLAPNTPETIAAIKKGSSNLKFISMISTGNNKKRTGSEEAENGTGSYVFKESDNGCVGAEEGKGEMQKKAPHSNWRMGNMDPDSVKTHHRQLARAGFKGNSDVIGSMGF